MTGETEWSINGRHVSDPETSFDLGDVLAERHETAEAQDYVLIYRLESAISR